MNECKRILLCQKWCDLYSLLSDLYSFLFGKNEKNKKNEQNHSSLMQTDLVLKLQMRQLSDSQLIFIAKQESSWASHRHDWEEAVSAQKQHTTGSTWSHSWCYSTFLYFVMTLSWFKACCSYLPCTQCPRVALRGTPVPFNNLHRNLRPPVRVCVCVCLRLPTDMAPSTCTTGQAHPDN